MTQDEIIDMAKQANATEIGHKPPAFHFYMKDLEAFAKLVAKKQAEECVFLCEELWRKGGWEHNAGFAADCIKKRFL